jgi:hypothetical protein
VGRGGSAAWIGAALLHGALVSLAAQEPSDPHAAQPERPTVATHAGTVAPGWLEVETGIEADHFDDGSHAQSIPTFLKFGLVHALQFGLGLPVLHPAGSSFGIGDVFGSLKWRIMEKAPVLGAFAMLASLKVPTGDQATGRGTGTTDFSLLAISSRTLGPVALDLNLGYTRRSGDGSSAPKEATVWTISTGFPIAGPAGMAAELFGYPGTGGPAGSSGIVALLFGPTLTVKPSLVLDAGFIVPIAGPQPDGFYAGLTWNAARLWRARTGPTRARIP